MLATNVNIIVFIFKKLLFESINKQPLRGYKFLINIQNPLNNTIEHKHIDIGQI